MLKVFIRKILFVDDAALNMHTEYNLKQLISQFNHASNEVGLTIKIKKKTIMGQDVSASPSININDLVLKPIDHLTYLGSTITNNLLLDMEIDKPISKVVAVMAKLNKRVWDNSQLTLCTWYSRHVSLALLYGSETWTTRQTGKPPGKFPSPLPATYPQYHCCPGASIFSLVNIVFDEWVMCIE